MGSMCPGPDWFVALAFEQFPKFKMASKMADKTREWPSISSISNLYMHN